MNILQMHIPTKFFTPITLLSAMLLLFCLAPSSARSQKFKVTLDAGHGDHDYGAVYNGHIEKNIALAVVLKVGKQLEQNNDIAVIYTRKTDVFVDLIERANIANRADSQLFVSIHCNANKNSSADGSETYVMGMTKIKSNLEAAKKENQVITMEKDYKQKYEGFDPRSPETMIGMTLMQEEFLDNSISMASKIQNKFIDNLGRKSRGVKQAPYMVLHKAYMPRVLIEMGFISNIVEGNFLDSEEGQEKMAQAIAEAILSYKKEYFGSGEANLPTVRPSQKMEEVKKNDSVAAPIARVSEPKETPKTTDSSLSVSGTWFKIQLSASPKKMELKAENFKGLSPISMTTDNGFNRYYYGQCATYDEAKRLLKEAKSKGYGSAFVIAYKNGQRVTIQEAMQP
jgi:N-acetylmuramoyl-L-alanine amidase